MKLRNHPLMSHHKVPIWPPVWIPLHRKELKSLKGEIGVLRYVIYNEAAPNKCFLIVDHEDLGYMGALIFDDPTFCQRIVKVLETYYDHPNKDIGDIDLTRTL
jgi:hypothetical protein